MDIKIFNFAIQLFKFILISNYEIVFCKGTEFGYAVIYWT